MLPDVIGLLADCHVTLNSPHLYLIAGAGSPNINIWAVLVVMALGPGMIIIGWLRRG